MGAEPGWSMATTGNLNGAQGTANDEAVRLLTGEMHMTTKVEMRLSAQGLRSRDTFGKSDPMAVLNEQVGNRWVERGRTEVKINDHNPEFVAPFLLMYAFESPQPLRVEVYDVDANLNGRTSAALDLKRQCDFLGEAEFMLAEMLQDQSMPHTLKLKRGQGNLTVRVQEHKGCKQSLQGTIRCTKLSNTGLAAWTDTPDPFVRISRDVFNPTRSQKIPVWESGVVKNQTTAAWSIDTSLFSLCRGDMQEQLYVEVYDWEKSGNHRCLGIAKVIVQEVAQGTKRLKLDHPTKGRPTKAEVSFEGMCLCERPTFLDYLNGGLQIGFSVAIDFTASNQAPQLPGSLHSMAQSPNQYEAAMQAVGNIIEFYNQTKMYTAWAFGCVAPRGAPHGADHCYALNGNRSNPLVQGVPGIMTAYRNCLNTTQLSGPTNFATVIQAACESAKKCQPGKRYECLLILTDGAVTDRRETIQAIIEATEQPMSIIIIGIGEADFDTMQGLDSDGGYALSVGHKSAKRDIVQFVPFNQHRGNSTALAAEVLKELPDQICEFMTKQQIRPGAGRMPASGPAMYDTPAAPHPSQPYAAPTGPYSASAYGAPVHATPGYPAAAASAPPFQAAPGQPVEFPHYGPQAAAAHPYPAASGMPPQFANSPTGVHIAAAAAAAGAAAGVYSAAAGSAQFPGAPQAQAPPPMAGYPPLISGGMPQMQPQGQYGTSPGSNVPYGGNHSV